MKPETEERDVLASNIDPGDEVIIDPNQQGWIIEILRSGLYKYKIKSPVREYLVNAKDEHRKHNIERPIEVTVPTEWKSELRIRDFGVGLLPETYDENGELNGGVKFYFGRYGNSTKRETNNEVGFMGIGAKSAFAYTDSYTIISYKDGTKYTFTSYLDENNVGRIPLLDQSATDEPNGLEIVIPVKVGDYYKFQNALKKLITYFSSKPIFHEVEIESERPEVKVSGERWRVTGGSDSLAIMGEIAYPIDAEAIDGIQETWSADYWMKELLEAGIEIDFPIGSIKMTPNREDLQMNEFTQIAIKNELRRIQSELQARIEEEFKACGSLFEAKCMYYELFMVGSSKDVFGKVVKEVTWNGQTISDNRLDLSDAGKITIFLKKKSRIQRFSGEEKLKCAKNMKLYLDDTEKDAEVNYRRRANTLLLNGSDSLSTVIVLTVYDETVLRSLGLNVATLPKYSTVVPTSLVSSRVSTSNGPDAAKRAKHSKKVFKLNEARLNNPCKTAASDYWEVVTVTDDKDAVYIPIERFLPRTKYATFPSGNLAALRKFKHLLTGIEKAGIVVPTIYGDKNGRNTFDSWLETEVRKLETGDIAIHTEFNSGSFPTLEMNPAGLGTSHIVSRYHELRKKAVAYDSGYIAAKEKLMGQVGVAQPNATSLLTTIRDEVYETYPLLALCMEKLTEYARKAAAQELLDYISDVDILNTKQRKAA